MNETLKFSWGHIIAFLALNAVSYISFVGFTYLTNGNFSYALIGMFLTDMIYLGVFIGAQLLKASGRKMRRKIIWERILVFGSPIIFIAGMISMSHFWTVKSREETIVENFKESINNSKKIFEDYDNYSDLRIENYYKMLVLFISNPVQYNSKFKEAGLESSMANLQRGNMVETLRLQLRSENYDTLRNSALKWIDNANQGARVWNVFIIGNTRQIKEAINNWENQLKSFSAKNMSNEHLLGDIPPFSSNGARDAIAGLDSMTESFTTQGPPTWEAIVFGIIIYIMLLFPYLLQDRHTKSPYINIISKRSRVISVMVDNSTKNSSSNPHRGTFRLD